PNYVLIYDARTRTFLDSFPQYIPEATSPWGYRDLAYDRANDVVYAGGEGNRLDVINATTHELVRTQTLRGNALPGTVRALAFDGESLYSANFNTAPVSKFSVNGTNCHQRAAVPPFSIYGLALDHGHGLVYGSTADNSGELLIYEYPSWALTDSVKIPEIVGGTMGGCETWLGDTFLLVIGQETPDKLHCFRLNMPLGVAEMPGSSRTMARIMTMTPARGGIEIHYFLERSGRVELAVYDASGRLVQRLVPCLVGAGSRLMTWGLTGSNGQRVVPGTYFCRLSVDGTSVIGKSIVLD
ncbi:MAG: hypothetical protein ABIK62_07325, partial [candidate division WOR-3 bacterium]